MNAVTRVVSTTSIYTARTATVAENSKQSLWVFALILIVFFSAFVMVYVKDLNRRLFIQTQHYQQVQNDATLQWSRLLLEKSTWTSQNRVEAIAEHKLNMVVPNPNQVVLIKVN